MGSNQFAPNKLGETPITNDIKKTQTLNFNRRGLSENKISNRKSGYIITPKLFFLNFIRNRLAKLSDQQNY